MGGGSGAGNVGNANIFISAGLDPNALTKIRSDLDKVVNESVSGFAAIGEALRREFGQKILFRSPFDNALVQKDIQGAIAALAQFEKALTDIGKVENQLELFPDVDAQKDRFIRAIRDIKAQLGTLRTEDATANSFPQISALQRGLQAFARVQEEANRENERRNRLLAAGVPVIDQTTKAIQRMGLIQDEATRHNATLSGSFGPLRRALDGINGKLASFGLTLRDVSIILGSGLLSGGIALVAREALRLGAAAIRTIVHLAELGGQLEHLRDQVEAAFGGAAEDAEEFAKRSAEAFGISEEAALTFIGRTGQLFQSFGIGKQAAVDLSEGLLRAAAVFRSTTVGAGSFQEVLDAIRNTVSGNIEGLRDYNATLRDQDLRELDIAKELKLTKGAFDSRTQSLLVTIAVLKEAQRREKDYAATSDSLAQSQESLGAKISDLGAQLGTAFTPIVKDVVDAISNLVDITVAAARELSKLAHVIVGDFSDFPEIQDKIDGVADSISGLLDKLGVTDFIHDSINAINDALEGLGFHVIRTKEDINNASDEQLKAFVKQLVAISKLGDGLNKENEALLKYAKSQLKVRGTTDEFNEAIGKSEEELRKHAADLKADEDAANRLADAFTRLDRAFQDFETRRAEASLRVSRAEEDGNRKVFRALRDRRDAYRDQARAIADSNAKVKDVQLQNFRDIRDAEEKLSDAQREGNKKRVDDADDLKKAIQQRAANILDATLGVEQALRRGSAEEINQAFLELTRSRQKEEIKEKEKEIQEDAADRALELFRLQRDLDEKRIDADKKLADAKEDLRRVIEDQDEKIVKAEEAVEDATRERDRANTDALTNLKNVQTETQRVLDDAILDYERLGGVVGGAAEKTKVLADQTQRLANILLSPVFQNPNPSLQDIFNAPLTPVPNPRNPDPFGPGSDSFQPLPKPGDDDFIGPVPTRSTSQTIIINEAHDSEATAAAVSRRLAQDVNA